MIYRTLFILLALSCIASAEARTKGAAGGNSTDGATLYHDYCSVCHGDSGQGAMWSKSGLDPAPVKFSSDFAKQELTRERMITSATYGRSETAMVGWGTRLNSSQIAAIVDYIRSEFMEITDENPQLAAQATSEESFTAADMSESMPEELSGDVNRGASLYMVNCATCHGVFGDGRGPRSYFISPKPRNFTHAESQAKFNRPFLFKAISKGRLKAEMPAWSTVWSNQQIADVAEFVFQTYIQKDQPIIKPDKTDAK